MYNVIIYIMSYFLCLCFSSDNPIVTIQEGISTTYNEGDTNKILHCTASSKPTSVFKWYHGNNPIRTSTSPVSTNQFNYNFDTVSKTHYGVYKCEADNSIGTKGQGSITVQVQCKSNITFNNAFRPLYQPKNSAYTSYSRSRISTQWKGTVLHLNSAQLMQLIMLST